MISAWSAIRHDLPLLWHIISNILYKMCVPTWYGIFMFILPLFVIDPCPLLCLCWSELWGRTHSKSKQQHFWFIQNLNYFISEHLPSWGQAADIPVYQWTAHCYECLQPHSVLLHYRQGDILLNIFLIFCCRDCSSRNIGSFWVKDIAARNELSVKSK